MNTSATPAFVPFSPTHAWAVVAFAACTIALVLYARPRRGSTAVRRVEIALGSFNLVCWVLIAAWWLRPSNFTWQVALPLQVCDLAALLAPITMLWPRRLFSTLLFFWGFGLSSQAFATPTLAQGPGDLYFWIFWYQHAAIVGGAVYEVAVRGYRPGWRDYWIAIGISYAYLAMALSVNAALGSNYGYVGRDRPGVPTALDLLGPWPMRVVWIVLIVHVAFAALTLPAWWLARRRPNATPAISAHGPQSPA
ncbi:MAG: TIGR02206 family membrane protein [Phycisphaerales bacterium]